MSSPPGAPLLLLIDDDAGDRAIVERAVAASYRVHGVASLEAALTLLRVSTPEVVVVDLSLGPASDDWAGTLAALSEITHAPLVVYTGHTHATTQPLRGLLLRAGADGVVAKEAPIAALTAALSDARDRLHRDRLQTRVRLAAVEQSLARLAVLVEQLVQQMADARLPMPLEPIPDFMPLPSEEVTGTYPQPQLPMPTPTPRPGPLQRFALWTPQQIASALAGLGVVGALAGGMARAIYTAWHGEPPVPVVAPGPAAEVLAVEPTPPGEPPMVTP